MKKKNEEYENMLEFIINWKKNNHSIDYYDVIWKKSHLLAEAQFLPAKKFFFEGLDDPDCEWRHDCATFLGFHYKLEVEEIEKFRSMLINDKDDDVRMASAMVLGSKSKYPDQALLSAIQFDQSKYVRKAAFESILRLAGISEKQIHQELLQIKDNVDLISFELVEGIIKSGDNKNSN